MSVIAAPSRSSHTARLLSPRASLLERDSTPDASDLPRFHRAWRSCAVVPADLAGLGQDSVINVTQLASVDRGLLEDRIGALPGWLMAHVDAGLGRALALDG